MHDHRAALAIGTNVGHYRIDNELGRGGFGITYRAHDNQQGLVAIKEFFPQHGSTRDPVSHEVRTTSERDRGAYEEGKQRVVTEARMLMQFRHRHIVKFLDIFQSNNTVYLALSYEPGTSLSKWRESMGRGPTQQEMDTLLPALLEALAVLHRSRVLHRDLAPDNIHLRSVDDPVILDFGTARSPIMSDGRPLTGFVKPGFSPHEQYDERDTSQQGPWTDIYAMAATLYWLIVGQYPTDARSRWINETMVPLSRMPGLRYRPKFLAAVDWGMRLKVRDRPQSVREWRDALLEVSSAHDPRPPGVDNAPPHHGNQPRPTHEHFDDRPLPARNRKKGLLGKLGDLLR